jgi:hypothetical protein
MSTTHSSEDKYHVVRLAPVMIGKTKAHKGVWRMRVMPKRDARLAKTVHAIRRVTKSAYGLQDVTVPTSHGVAYEVAWTYELPHQEQRARSAFQTIARELVRRGLLDEISDADAEPAATTA